VRTSLLKLRNGLGSHLALAALLTILMAAFTNNRRVETLSARLVVNLIVSLAIGGTLLATRVVLLDRVDLAARPRPVRLAVRAGVMVAAVLLGVELAHAIAGALFPAHTRWFPRRAMILVALPLTLVMTVLSRGREQLERRAAALQASEAEAREQLLRAQLEALKARTNPHFLFNSLNAVASLIGEDPPRAEAAVLRLASLLRYALEGATRDKVPLADEFAHVESYLAFERLRFGERLASTVELEAGLGATLVPPLILQPLVENAVNHGVGARRGGGCVAVRARRAPGGIALSVEDDGPGPGASPHHGTRTSQADLERRLRLAYGDRASFTTSRGPMGGFRVEIELPS
jgi:sensor histidine kinase YesM